MPPPDPKTRRAGPPPDPAPRIVFAASREFRGRTGRPASPFAALRRQRVAAVGADRFPPAPLGVIEAA